MRCERQAILLASGEFEPLLAPHFLSELDITTGIILIRYAIMVAKHLLEWDRRPFFPFLCAKQKVPRKMLSPC